MSGGDTGSRQTTCLLEATCLGESTGFGETARLRMLEATHLGETACLLEAMCLGKMVSFGKTICKVGCHLMPSS